MEPIRLEELMGHERYGAERDAIRRRIIAHKHLRRVAVGDRISLLFEDRATVWYQTVEMCWVEHVTDLDAVRQELEVYNQLLPAGAELSATLLIEITEPTRVPEELHRLIGIDECVTLEIGDRLRVPGRFEAGRQTEEKLSAVQYVRFPLGSDGVTAIAGGAPLALVVDHPNYRARVTLPEPIRASVAADVTDPSAADAALRRVRDGA